MKSEWTNKNLFGPISPGEVLEQEIESRGWDRASCAAKLSLDQETLEAIIDGTGKITPGIAAGLALALGTSRQYWINLEKVYRQYSGTGVPPKKK